MKITSILTHYKRPCNVKLWMDGIRKQTIQSEIIVWDNSGDYPEGSGEDVLIRCSKNYHAYPKFLMACLADTEYVYLQDDDKKLIRDDFFSTMIGLCMTTGAAYGYVGRKFNVDLKWETPYSYPSNEKSFVRDDAETDCDILVTSACFFRTADMNRCEMNQRALKIFTEQEILHCDDLLLSRYFEKKRAIPSRAGFFEELDEPHAISKRPDHMSIRDSVIKKIYGRSDD